MTLALNNPRYLKCHKKESNPTKLSVKALTTVLKASTEIDNYRIILLEKGPAQAKSVLNSPERVARNIGIYVNANKTEYMCFNRGGAISILNGGPLKLGD